LKKIVSIIASPNPKGNTSAIVDAIYSGVTNKNYKTEKIFLRDYNIQYCINCEKCYVTGQCVINDGFDKILADIEACDILVLASPVWHDAVTGQLKVFLDRFCASQLKFTVTDGVTSMMPRLSDKVGLAVLCGCTDKVHKALPPIQCVLGAMKFKILDPVIINKVGLTDDDHVSKHLDLLCCLKAYGETL